MTGRGEEPTPIGEGVERILQGLGAPPPAAVGTLVERWVDAVGPTLATVTTPGSLRDGVLVVTTSEPAVAEHLRWHEGEVVEGVNRVLGEPVVRGLRTRVEPR